MSFAWHFYEFLLLKFSFPCCRFRNVKSCRMDWAHRELLQAPKMFNECTTEHNIYFHNYHIVCVGKLCKSITWKKGSRDDDRRELVEKHAGGVDRLDPILLSPSPKNCRLFQKSSEGWRTLVNKMHHCTRSCEEGKSTTPPLELTHWHRLSCLKALLRLILLVLHECYLRCT